MTAPSSTTGYRIVLPQGWHRLPADPIALRPVVRQLLLDLWADQPRDQTAQRRRGLSRSWSALPARDLPRLLIPEIQFLQPGGGALPGIG